MVFSSKASNGIGTRAEGSFTNCDLASGNVEISYSCQGPACSSLDASFLDIECHKDGSSRLVCSNDYKCQSRTTSYQSNFTFSQNEPDPWSPTMENKADVWVPQHQHVLVASCARFSVTSDGSERGTWVEEESPPDACLGTKDVSTVAEQTSVLTGRPHAAATQRPFLFAGQSTRRNPSTASLLLISILIWFLVLPGVLSSAARHPHLGPHRKNDFRLRATSRGAKTFAEEFRLELAQRAEAQGIHDEAFADTLVASVISSVCGTHYKNVVSDSFNPEVIRNCLSSVYANQLLPQPRLQFLAVFGASLLCGYVVSEAYPDGQILSPAGCEGLEALMNGDSTLDSVLSQPPSVTPPVSSANTEPSVPWSTFALFLTSPRSYQPMVFSSHMVFSPSARVSEVSTLPFDLTPVGRPSSSRSLPTTAVAIPTPNDLGKASSSATSASSLSLTTSPLTTILPASAVIPAISNVTPVTSRQTDSRGADASTPGSRTPGSFETSSGVSITMAAMLQTDASLSEVSIAPADMSLIPTNTASETIFSTISSVQLRPSDRSDYVAEDVRLATVASASGTYLAPSRSMQTGSEVKTTASSTLILSSDISSDHSSSKIIALDAPHLGLSSTISIDLDVTTGDTLAFSPDSEPLTSGGKYPPTETPPSLQMPHTSEATARSTMTISTHVSVHHHANLSSDDTLSLANTDQLSNPPGSYIFNSTPNQAMSAPIIEVVETITVIKATTSTGSSTKSSLSSRVYLPEDGFVDPSTTSWYEDLLLGPSQFGLLSRTPQPSNITSTLSVDHRYGQSQIDTTGESGAYSSRHQKPALTFLTSARPSSTPGSLPASSSISLMLFISTATSTSELGSASPRRASATQLDPPMVALPSLPIDGSTFLETSNLRNTSFAGSPGLLDATVTASSASILVSMSPPSAVKSIVPMTSGLDSADEIVVTAVRTITVHLVPTSTPTKFATLHYQASPVSCARSSKALNFCPGSGCVSLMTDKAHCGACSQRCEHSCHQGVCVCPDFARPNGDNVCMNKPGSGACVIGYARNIFRVCTPIWPSGSFTPTTQQLPSLETTVPPFALSAWSGPKPVSALAFSTQTSDLGTLDCPPELPNTCDGGCVNTKNEHNHCGGCGNSCSGACKNGWCLATATPSRLQLVSTQRTITVTRVLTESPVRAPVSSTLQPVASYIWKGLVGVQ